MCIRDRVFTCCYAYQLFFLAVPFTKKQEPHKPEVLHRFAILICARNEEAVIADLIQSIRHQTCLLYTSVEVQPRGSGAQQGQQAVRGEESAAKIPIG